MGLQVVKLLLLLSLLLRVSDLVLEVLNLVFEFVDVILADHVGSISFHQLQRSESGSTDLRDWQLIWELGIGLLH